MEAAGDGTKLQPLDTDGTARWLYRDRRLIVIVIVLVIARTRMRLAAASSHGRSSSVTEGHAIARTRESLARIKTGPRRSPHGATRHDDESC